ncbi:hypothetical protein DICPUDRAFT_149926 [Dictyostelium purpureum]|uniref:Uncharacterized protein n=1 Tax=Dictyostelium purpureum TaxID=5786 RepID=F0ZF07_DICPU|nr:uncharacterized protein DICPUDRAFT_149926 [Dictyostelium purpureum]EGC37436.1 hypothetical protein DICPUDRAFT_149926 [Dictyostelium purpureum]|eukprot:XP_003286000.1 hypothetical protein DICPUDRAFT_149926 [Dictyostelium purpureum]
MDKGFNCDNEVFFWRVYRNKFIRNKIFKEFRIFFEAKYSYYEIISIEWMVKNRHYNLLKEKIRNKETLSFNHIYVDDSERFNESHLFSSATSLTPTSYRITKNMDITTLKIFKYSVFNCPEFKYKEEYKELYLTLFENYGHYFFSFISNNLEPQQEPQQQLQQQSQQQRQNIIFNNILNLINNSANNFNEMNNLALKMIEYDNAIVLEIFIEKFKFKPKVDNFLRALSINSLKVAEFLFKKFDFKVKNKEKLWRDLCETYLDNTQRDLLPNTTTTSTAAAAATNVSFAHALNFSPEPPRIISSNQINQRALFLVDVMKFEPPSVALKDFKYLFNLVLFDQPLRVLYESCMVISLLKQPLKPYINYISDRKSNKFNIKNIESFQKLDQLKLPPPHIIPFEELREMNFSLSEMDQLVKNYPSVATENNEVNQKVERLIMMIVYFLDPYPNIFGKNITYFVSKYYQGESFQILKDWSEKETFYKYCSKERELQLTNYLVSIYSERDIQQLKFLMNMLISQDKIDSVKIVYDKLYKITMTKLERIISTDNSTGYNHAILNNIGHEDLEKAIVSTIFIDNIFLMVNSTEVFDFIYEKSPLQFQLNQIFPQKCFLIKHFYKNHNLEYKVQTQKFYFQSRAIQADSLRFIYDHLDDFRVSLSYLISNWWELSKQFQKQSPEEHGKDSSDGFQKFKFFISSANYMKGPEITLYHYYNNTFNHYLLEKISSLNDLKNHQKQYLHHTPGSFDSTNYSLTNSLNQVMGQIATRGDIETLSFIMKTLFPNENDNLVERKFIIGVLFSATSVGQLRIFKFLNDNYSWVFKVYDDSIYNSSNYNNNNNNNSNEFTSNDDEKKLEVFQKSHYRITTDILKRMVSVSLDHCHIDTLNYLQTIPAFRNHINYNLMKRFI